MVKQGGSLASGSCRILKANIAVDDFSRKLESLHLDMPTILEPLAHECDIAGVGDVLKKNSLPPRPRSP